MLRVLGLIALAALIFLGWGYVDSLADPVILRADVAVAGWPAGTPPVRVALLADVHVQGPDMPPERVARIVAQVNAQHPDLILLAGDFIGSRKIATHDYTNAEIAAPLAKLHAPLGVFAVLGNHDHWHSRGAIRGALQGAGIPVLMNNAVRAGPLVLAGVDDVTTGHGNIGAVLHAAAALPGPLVLLSHSPDVTPRLPPEFGLVLAGHTHCGQIVLPFIGAVASSTRYGERYRCGLIREGSRTVVVTAGLGTSVVPLRFGAPPDWWLLTLGGKR